MQTVSSGFLEDFKQAYSASGTPRATIEWNMNRFGLLDRLENNGQVISKDRDDPVFPLHSVIGPRRPEIRGIVKGFTSAGASYEAKAYSSKGTPTRRRTYTASPDSKYKYWVSPGRSSLTRSATTGFYNIQSVSPTVVYKDSWPVNKLHVLFESTAATPQGVKIYVTYDGTNWQQAGGTYTPDSLGIIDLYLQDNGTWSSTRNINNHVELKGMRVVVTGMSHPESHLHLIEMAPMREIDFTERTINYSISNELSEHSSVAPLGKASSNTGNLTLSNHDGFLDNDRSHTQLAGMMESPAKVKIDLAVHAGGLSEWVRQATMFVDSWGEQTDDVRSLSLTDASHFLKEEKPPALLLTNVTATEVIWRILDSIGFSNYVITEDPAGDAKIPYYWTDPEKTVWEHFQEISEAMQLAVYFDEMGNLKVAAREGVFKKELPTAWTFDGQTVTNEIATEEGRASDVGKLPDIISMSKPSELDANVVNVNYTKTHVSDFNKGQPPMETVWQPEGDVVLRSASLVGDMTATGTTAPLGGSNFSTWPFEGYLDIDGEIVKWTKKKYMYRNSSGAWDWKYLASAEEETALDNLNPRLAHQNYYNGYLYLGSNRGMMSTAPRAHSTKHKFTLLRHRHGTNTIQNRRWYVYQYKERSTLGIKSTASFKSDSYVTASKGNSADPPPYYFGTSLKFDKTTAYADGAAGIFIAGGAYEAGYYIEMNLTSNVGTRKYTNEISMYKRTSNGKRVRLAKGSVLAVEKGKWYDIDVQRMQVGGGQRFTVMVNGVYVLRVDVSSSDVGSYAPFGRYGLFVRGHTHAEFEYIYASNSLEPPSPDDMSRADLIDGGMRSNYYHAYLYKQKNAERLSRWSANRYTRNIGFAFDEFGAEAHELREFNVKFDPNPVIHSNLYISNQWKSDCVEYVADHDSARFIVIGKARENVILNGDDSLLYGADNVVNQKMLIYGRVVKTDEEEKYTVRNEASVNRRGVVELDISSPWIQSEPSAKKIGDWIVNHWADGSEQLSVSTFGNPFIQLGDVVGVSYRRKSMKANTHRYYVVGIRHSYDQGLTTDFTLQRVSG